MDRRTFIANVARGLVAVPLATEAQQAGKIYRIGYLSAAAPAASATVIDAFRQGLRERGWVEGQNIVIDYRFAEGRYDRLPDLAAELVRLNIDVIVAAPTPPAMAASKATRTIPIVMIGVDDPVGTGPRLEPRATGRQRDRPVLQRRPGNLRQAARAVEGGRAQGETRGGPLEPGRHVADAHDAKR